MDVPRIACSGGGCGAVEGGISRRQHAEFRARWKRSRRCKNALVVGEVGVSVSEDGFWSCRRDKARSASQGSVPRRQADPESPTLAAALQLPSPEAIACRPTRNQLTESLDGDAAAVCPNLACSDAGTTSAGCPNGLHSLVLRGTGSTALRDWAEQRRLFGDRPSSKTCSTGRVQPQPHWACRPPIPARGNGVLVRIRVCQRIGKNRYVSVPHFSQRPAQSWNLHSAAACTYSSYVSPSGGMLHAGCCVHFIAAFQQNCLFRSVMRRNLRTPCSDERYSRITKQPRIQRESTKVLIHLPLPFRAPTPRPLTSPIPLYRAIATVRHPYWLRLQPTQTRS